MKKIISGLCICGVVLSGAYARQGQPLKAAEEQTLTSEMLDNVSQQLGTETVSTTTSVDSSDFQLEESSEGTVENATETSDTSDDSNNGSTSTQEESSATEETATATSEESTENFSSDSADESLENIEETTDETTQATTGTEEALTEDTTGTTMQSSSESEINHSKKPEKPKQNKRIQSKNVPKSIETPQATPSLPKTSVNLSDITVNAVPIPEAMKASGVALTNLGEFELPLLTSYVNNRQGAIVYELIKQVGVEKETWSTAELAEDVFAKLFAISLNELPKETITFDEILPGDIVYQMVDGKEILLGVYLGQEYLISVEEELEEEGSVGYSATIQKSSMSEELLVQRVKTDLTDDGKQVLSEYPVSFGFNSNILTQKFIDRIAEDARRLGAEYDVFASVMIAQAILESGSGSSGLSMAPYYNLFGIKGSYQGNAAVLSTKEDRGDGSLYEIQSAFRAYPNYAASLGDYVQLLRGGISGNGEFYQDTWRTKAKNYLRATDALTGKYATDTLYNKKLNSLIAVYHLTQFDRLQATDTNLIIQNISEVPEEYRNLMKYPLYDGKDYNTSGSYPAGQCTWYAYNRVHQLGMTVDDYMGNGGEWGEKGQKLGYTVLQKPQVGTVISFKPHTNGSSSEYGHVAFVEAVGPAGILISEGNVIDESTISYRVIGNDVAYSDAVSYIVPQK